MYIGSGSSACLVWVVWVVWVWVEASCLVCGAEADWFRKVGFGIWYLEEQQPIVNNYEIKIKKPSFQIIFK
jgi:hypothetical protein